MFKNILLSAVMNRARYMYESCEGCHMVNWIEGCLYCFEGDVNCRPRFFTGQTLLACWYW